MAKATASLNVRKGANTHSGIPPSNFTASKPEKLDSMQAIIARTTVMREAFENTNGIMT